MVSTSTYLLTVLGLLCCSGWPASEDSSPKNCLQQEQPLRYLALGDSYTIGESVATKNRYPNQLVQRLNNNGININKAEIIAKTGWRTDDLIYAVKRSKSECCYDLVSLLIGVNNQYQGKAIHQYELEFEVLLKTAIKLAGGEPSKVMVISIPDYGFTPFGKNKQTSVSKELNTYNEINRSISQQYGVSWIKITPISEQGLEHPDLVADDGLHPSAQQYSKWVDLIYSEALLKLK